MKSLSPNGTGGCVGGGKAIHRCFLVQQFQALASAGVRESPQIARKTEKLNF
jgi:hypothetical protein